MNSNIWEIHQKISNSFNKFKVNNSENYVEKCVNCMGINTLY